MRMPEILQADTEMLDTKTREYIYQMEELFNMGRVNLTMHSQDLIYMAWILEDWARYQKGKALWEKEAREAEDFAKTLRKYAEYSEKEDE